MLKFNKVPLVINEFDYRFTIKGLETFQESELITFLFKQDNIFNNIVYGKFSPIVKELILIVRHEGHYENPTPFKTGIISMLGKYSKDGNYKIEHVCHTSSLSRL